MSSRNLVVLIMGTTSLPPPFFCPFFQFLTGIRKKMFKTLRQSLNHTLLAPSFSVPYHVSPSIHRIFLLLYHCLSVSVCGLPLFLISCTLYTFGSRLGIPLLDVQPSFHMLGSLSRSVRSVQSAIFQPTGEKLSPLLIFKHKKLTFFVSYAPFSFNVFLSGAEKYVSFAACFLGETSL